MIKIFDGRSGWHTRTNFVDSNNRFVGYDLDQSCCEYADWFIADEITFSIEGDLNQPSEVDGYVFDPDFFKDISDRVVSEGGGYNPLDSGGMVVFKLDSVIDKGKVKYLHIFNAHNGYYSHGLVGGADFDKPDELEIEQYL